MESFNPGDQLLLDWHTNEDYSRFDDMFNHGAMDANQRLRERSSFQKLRTLVSFESFSKKITCNFIQGIINHFV